MSEMKYLPTIAVVVSVFTSGCTRSAFMPAMATHQPGTEGDAESVTIRRQATIPDGSQEIGHAMVLARSQKRREKLMQKVAAENGGTSVVDFREGLSVPMIIIPLPIYTIVVHGTLESATIVKTSD
ncbi:MAG: hypothetical protein B7733_25685 [Myxococcales bacterium FL481]|nr:MAG: hypothetical protein B7733_25685 [Myxococcales bacterium FL481]